MTRRQNRRRSAPPPVDKPADQGAAGPQAFDGRENMRGLPTKRNENPRT